MTPAKSGPGSDAATRARYVAEIKAELKAARLRRKTINEESA